VHLVLSADPHGGDSTLDNPALHGAFGHAIGLGDAAGAPEMSGALRSGELAVEQEQFLQLGFADDASPGRKRLRGCFVLIRWLKVQGYSSLKMANA
jgi:hypothetical protein